MPIRNADDEVVAVAQVINKIGAPEGFSKDDEKVKQRALSIVTNEAKYVSCKTVPVKMRKNKQKFVLSASLELEHDLIIYYPTYLYPV